MSSLQARFPQHIYLEARVPKNSIKTIQISPKKNALFKTEEQTSTVNQN